MNFFQKMNFFQNKKGGFTLLEVLLSLVIIGLLVGMSAPILRSFQIKNDLDVASNIVVETARRAQLLSQAVEGDSTWGIKVFPEKVVLFKGKNYNQRQKEYDEITDLPSTILAIEQDDEVVFSKMEGFLSREKKVVLVSRSQEKKEIVFNLKGIIEY